LFCRENALVSAAEREILDTKFNEFLQAHKDNLFEQSDKDIKWAQLEWLVSVFLPQVIDILLAGKENKSQELWAGVNLVTKHFYGFDFLSVFLNSPYLFLIPNYN